MHWNEIWLTVNCFWVIVTFAPIQNHIETESLFAFRLLTMFVATGMFLPFVTFAAALKTYWMYLKKLSKEYIFWSSKINKGLKLCAFRSDITCYKHTTCFFDVLHKVISFGVELLNAQSLRPIFIFGDWFFMIWENNLEFWWLPKIPPAAMANIATKKMVNIFKCILILLKRSNDKSDC